ncbi:GNAT family acetyltransferase [Phragmitibacter flavus]|uniref:GNAT family acetyltransferase n=1 Tax=Phragmitibacter flavus TaxID=2576071 RepID=A0A5R8KD98_9BACT|nr:GNAT family acetyltransferase [Phragmitibacter flavus]TLD70278.1 GNAT family acetyltransferase [Phragmitibacter flavus]
MNIRTYNPSDENAVIHLWELCGLIAPQNNPQLDIQRKLADSPDLFLVGTHDYNNEIVATVMAGYDGHRGWINYLAVAPHLQKTGYGRQIMDHAETLLRELGCPKINLQVRSTNQQVIDFYQRIGFTFDDVQTMGKRLVTDEPYQG